MARYKLLAGHHIQQDSDGVIRSYKGGDVLDSETDLCQRFNHPEKAYLPKFEKVMDSDQSFEAEAARRGYVPADKTPLQVKGNLEDLTVKELQQLAADDEIDLKGAKSKEEIIRVLKANMVTA